MRDDVALAESGLRWRIVVGCLLLVAGITGMALGLAGVGSEPTYVLGGGTFGVLVGTALLSPVLGRPVLSGLAGSTAEASARWASWPSRTPGGTCRTADGDPA